VSNRKISLLLLSIGCVLWLVSIVVQPYTTWGDPPKIRADASYGIVVASMICLAFLLASALTAYWTKSDRRGWPAICLAIALAFFGTTALARFVYVQFVVLSKL